MNAPNARRTVPLAAFALGAFALLSLGLSVSGASAISRIYTLNADFDEGSLLNVNHDIPDQLQLNQTTTPFPFINIACSGRGTIVRIDVNTGAILGEYLTSPDGMGRNPSRTTVDQFGNVWVSNRDEAGVSGGENKGSVTRVGLVIGGTRCDADGTPNPLGQYLKPPFLYSTCPDRDGDGLIKTSRGLGDVLPWTNAGGADTEGGVSTADDECIINFTRVAGANTRTVAIDGNNNLWTGGFGDFDHELVDGVTGLPIAGTRFNLGCGGYGGLVDQNGVLWSAGQYTFNLLRFVPNASPPPAGTGECLADRGNYGLGIDPRNGHIWHSSLDATGRLYELDVDGSVLNSYQQPFDAQGVCVDANGHVWMAEIFGDEVWHLAPDPMNPAMHVAVGTVGGFLGVTGVAVDANGKIWGAEINGNRAARIDPNAGPIGGGGYPVGAIDMTVDLGPGASPYNYSDMTGFVAIGSTAPQGTWDVVFDSGSLGEDWGTASWTSTEPAMTAIRVEVRAADLAAELPTKLFVLVGNGVPFTGIEGRFIEIRATLSRESGTQESPILYDLTIESSCPVINCPLSQGYWKNHEEAWPDDAVPMRLGTVNDYSLEELIAILRTPIRGDASLILAHQLIAAKVNVANCADPDPIEDVIAAADLLIGTRLIPIVPKVMPNTEEGGQMTMLAFWLDLYNNGFLTPDCAEPSPDRIAFGLPAIWPAEAIASEQFVDLFGVEVAAGREYHVGLINDTDCEIGVRVLEPPKTMLTPGDALDTETSALPGEALDVAFTASSSERHLVAVVRIPNRPGAVLGTYRLAVSLGPTGVDVGTAPETFALWSNVPNPFNPYTTVRYAIPAPGARVRIDIVNASGQHVRTLVDDFRPAGIHHVSWDGRSDSRTEVASGPYFYTMRSGAFVETRRMMLLK